MSRIGKKPIAIPDKVKVSVEGKKIKVEGPLGKLERELPKGIKAQSDGKTLTLNRQDESNEQKALHGLARALVQNMVTGVSVGYTKELEIHGTGYRAELKGTTVVMSLGFSHQVEYPMPPEIKVAVDTKANKITLKSANKHLIGFVASKIKAIRPPEPYKQKGIRFAGEAVKVKVGKTGAK